MSIFGYQSWGRLAPKTKIISKTSTCAIPNEDKMFFPQVIFIRQLYKLKVYNRFSRNNLVWDSGYLTRSSLSPSLFNYNKGDSVDCNIQFRGKRKDATQIIKNKGIITTKTPLLVPVPVKPTTESDTGGTTNSNEVTGKVNTTEIPSVDPVKPSSKETARDSSVDKTTATSISKVEESIQEPDGTEKKRNVRGSGTPNDAKSKGRSAKQKNADRNFVTAVRAMADFLLRPEDLVGLRKTMRRSPHSDEPPITVFWRKDVEAKAIDIYGDLVKMKEERALRLQQIGDYSEVVSNIKKVLIRYKKEHPDEALEIDDIAHYEPFVPDPDADTTNKGRHPDPKYDPFVKAKTPVVVNVKAIDSFRAGSGRIVMAAVIINGTNFVIKFLAWWMTGSHSLFAESIHSLADTLNQCILAFGIHKSNKRPNTDHPYGYSNMKYVASLISGVGIFCVGSGLSIYHGVTGLMTLHQVESLYWAFYILAGSFVSEGATLLLAANAVRKRAKAQKISFKEFVFRSHDPSLNVVMLEDTASVMGVFVAALCMGITVYTGNPFADAAGSLVIGGLLGGVASFIVYTNSSALVGRSIRREQLEVINYDLEQDFMVRGIHDVKGMDIGNSLVRYKAEIDFDGRELAKLYTEKKDLSKLLQEIKLIKNEEEAEEFVLKHGENIVDTLGAEIDRIESRLKKEHPEIRHCDLEIL